jgi:hypothetical protein
VEGTQQATCVNHGGIDPQRAVPARHVNPAWDVGKHLTAPVVDAARSRSAIDARGPKVRQ